MRKTSHSPLIHTGMDGLVRLPTSPLIVYGDIRGLIDNAATTVRAYRFMNPALVLLLAHGVEPWTGEPNLEKPLSVTAKYISSEPRADEVLK